jgi:hypothetical protein
MSFHGKDFSRLFFLYRAYICLQSSKGNHKAAINELIRLNSVYKKMSLNARSLLMKSICIAGLEADTIPTNFIINNPETPYETLLLIEQHIVPISEEYTSLRNTILFEYLTFKYTIKSMPLDPRVKHVLPPVLKLNSSLRLFINFCNKCIGEDENKDAIKEYRIWPTLYPNLPVQFNRDGKLPLYYKIYNIVGCELIQDIVSEIESVTSAKIRAEVRSDLLQIVLNKRLGKEVSLKAHAYSDEYIIDIENKIIFSPGPDGKSYTDDDIILPINPEVLNLTQ